MPHTPIALFYGSSTCYTEIAAEKIQAALGADRVTLFNIAAEPITTATDYACVILGIPTWDYGELQADWEGIWPELDSVDWRGKKIALFGLGDQIGYPDWFQDALGYLWARLVNLGAVAVGLWPVAGYQFSESRALTADGNHFVGLALDDENEAALTDERIAQWCGQIDREFGPSLDQ
ncbi:MAG: flavodoxin FldB [Porticoccaceae bacterium]